jgi:hypothetical protein
MSRSCTKNTTAAPAKRNMKNSSETFMSTSNRTPTWCSTAKIAASTA